jgi:hypothetical protein
MWVGVAVMAALALAIALRGPRAAEFDPDAAAADYDVEVFDDSNTEFIRS